MMRSIISGVILLVSATFAQAAVSPDALRQLAYEGKYADVDAVMREAHQQSLSGEISYDDLRGLVFVLTRTHPDMVDFRHKWLEAIPDSPYALTAQAWYTHNEAYNMRGTALARDVPREAIWEFSRLKNEAHRLMLRAYDLAPDFAPASDGAIRMLKKRGILWQWQLDRIVAAVMADTPNFGTLQRASTHSDRRWGGVGPALNDDLCDRYFDKIPEYPDLTKDACTVSLMALNGQLDERSNFVADVLDREDHEVLAYARVRRALERKTDEDRQIVMQYLDNVSFDTPWFHSDLEVAQLFSSNWTFIQDEESIAFRQRLQNRLHEEVHAQLVHDPFTVELLRIAAWDYNLISDLRLFHNYEHFTYWLRIAVAQPYDLSNWMKAGIAQGRLMDGPSLNILDTGYHNAVAYSDHNVFMITNFLQAKLSQYDLFLELGEGHVVNDRRLPSEEVFMTEVGCTLATLIRLFRDAAAIAPEEHRNSLDGTRIGLNIDQVENDLKASGYCDHIWETSMEDLRLEPIEIDRRSLLNIEEKVFPAYRLP